MSTQSPAPHASTTEAQRVTVITPTLVVEGNIFLSKVGKDDRRLTSYLNSDKRFMAMTDVVMVDRLSSAPKPVKYDFVQIKFDSIECIKPHA